MEKRKSSAKYFVLIGDIVGSRELPQRSSLQKKFADTLKTVQEKYAAAIISPLTLTIGDEFQAVLQNADHLFDILRETELALDDVTFRYGLGIGNIDTEINRQYSIGMDGPAFHFAREAVEEARIRNIRFRCRCDDPFKEKRLNILLGWLDVSTHSWSKEKKMIFHLRTMEMAQKQIAEHVGMSQPAVSQHINAAVFKLAGETEIQIQQEINRILEGR